MVQTSGLCWCQHSLVNRYITPVYLPVLVFRLLIRRVWNYIRIHVDLVAPHSIKDMCWLHWIHPGWNKRYNRLFPYCRVLLEQRMRHCCSVCSSGFTDYCFGTSFQFILLFGVKRIYLVPRQNNLKASCVSLGRRSTVNAWARGTTVTWSLMYPNGFLW